MPKIALVHDFLRTYGGAERVLTRLHILYPEAPIYTLLADPVVISRHFPNADIRTSSLQRSLLKNQQQFLLPRLPRAIEEFNFNEYDVVISSSGAFSHGIITGPDTRHICYCHSPMRYAWDWQAEYLEEHGVRSASALMAASTVMNSIRTWDYVASKRVDKWIANSATVQARIKKFYGQESTVIYPPVTTSFFTSEISETLGAYAVTVTRLSRYKRVDAVLQACAQQNLPLIIVGDGPERQTLERLARTLHADVRFAGRCSDQELKHLLQGARCFISAVEEDFGIAPVEAVSSGVPVIALGKGGTAETISDGATGILFPDLDQLPATLHRFLTEGVSKTRAEISESAKRFGEAAFDTAITHLVTHA